MHMNRIRILGLVLIFSVAGFAEQHKTPQGCGRGRSGNRDDVAAAGTVFFPGACSWITGATLDLRGGTVMRRR
jgi:hypothetical protein